MPTSSSSPTYLTPRKYKSGKHNFTRRHHNSQLQLRISHDNPLTPLQTSAKSIFISSYARPIFWRNQHQNLHHLPLTLILKSPTPKAIFSPVNFRLKSPAPRCLLSPAPLTPNASKHNPHNNSSQPHNSQLRLRKPQRSLLTHYRRVLRLYSYHHRQTPLLTSSAPTISRLTAGATADK